MMEKDVVFKQARGSCHATKRIVEETLLIQDVELCLVDDQQLLTCPCHATQAITEMPFPSSNGTCT